MKHLRILFTLLCVVGAGQLYSQNDGKIQPALLTLFNISPDARSSGMGEVGAATSPDLASQHWNAAKYSFLEGKGGINVSYVPWLRQMAKDINHAYLSGYYSLPDNQTLSASLYFFSLGNISLYNENADYMNEVKPRDFAFDLAYGRRFGKEVSAALTFRYINSSVITGTGSQIYYVEHISNFAVDIAAYWQHPVRLWGTENSEVAAGISISNLGTKLEVSDGTKYFLPMNMRVGGRLTGAIDSDNKLSLSVDLNKLLVPEDYKYNTEAVPSALFYSFGDGASSVMTNAGLEYMYTDFLAVRTGFYAEANRLGGRRYISFGIGLKYRMLGFDMSYLTAVKGQDGVLSNTLKFSLSLLFSKRPRLDERVL